jgi:hypothetical protein
VELDRESHSRNVPLQAVLAVVVFLRFLAQWRRFEFAVSREMAYAEH